MQDQKMVLITVEELESRVFQTVAKALAAERSRSQQENRERKKITKREAADILGVSISTIGNLTRAGLLKKWKVGKALRFDREEVESLAQKDIPKRPRAKKK